MQESFKVIQFKESSLKVIAQAVKICRDYKSKGYNLTLRQLYYQFVAHDLLPNTQKSYDRLGAIISDGRMSGLIDWDYIQDRTRNAYIPTLWDSPNQILAIAANQFKMDINQEQDCYIEVWVEKDALSEIAEQAAADFRLPVFACRGYVSQSEMYAAAKRISCIKYTRAKDPRCIILHLGDHDPSGIDMTRDIEERLNLFASVPIEIKRIALNRDQIDKYEPPPNPAKVTDSRYEAYAVRHGAESWELDAIEPATLEEIIRFNILEYYDMDVWTKEKHREKVRRDAAIKAVAGLGDL